MDGERGSASVEHAALVLLAALVACAVVALVAIGPERKDGALALAIAFKQRCAVRYPVIEQDGFVYVRLDPDVASVVSFCDCAISSNTSTGSPVTPTFRPGTSTSVSDTS